ncbi:MAG: topoisomerase DNA-binding C4 zinc finger domain-containing protein, partial [Candidatus Riflebacteria bacterium]|nr:topoisomerase DNA-binding C4 zinc finger domain-containing protein [Candidatus Riflebacteria bacterium]
VSPEAQAIARDHLTEVLGPRYIPAQPPVYKSPNARAQDAHEAIRPTDVRLEPREIKHHLSPDQYKLYSLVWTRFMASQMASAEFLQRTVDVAAGRYVFRAVGREKLFVGYLKIYEGHSVVTKKAKETFLPPLAEGEKIDRLGEKAEQGFTQPPPHYTEASLVKTLEEKGIGRPSTYATIISTLLERGYVDRDQKNLMPTELGGIVVELLEANFQKIMDVEFTAGLEGELDEIEKGKFRWQEVLGRFYDDFKQALSTAEKQMKNVKKEVVETGEVCEKCGKPMVIRRGRFGKFIACSGFPECRNTREVPKEGQPAAPPQEPPQMLDETCEKCGSRMQLRKGRFGQFKACSSYPKCKNTKPVLAKLGVPCPEKGCSGEIVTRFSRNRRMFYGCCEYPKCTFTSWVRVAKGSCPTCGSYVVEKRTKNVLEAITCAAKGCGWTRPPDPETENKA